MGAEIPRERKETRMFARELNSDGVITYNKLIVEQLIAQALAPYKKKVYLARYRGPSSDLSVKIGNFDALEEREIRMTPNGVYIRLCVMIRMGQSISQLCRDIIDRLAGDIEEQLQLPVDNIVIQVTGVLAKKPVARHLYMDYKSKELHESE